MRVALVSDIYRPQLSGIADSIAILSRELHARGHAVRILAPALPGAEPDPDVTRMPAFAIPGWGGLSLVWPKGVTRALEAFRADIVHVHTVSTLGLAGLRAARRLNVPVLGTDHTFPAAYLHYAKLDVAPLRAAADRFAAAFYGRCDIVTAPSAAVLKALRAGGMRGGGHVVSNPIDLDLFSPLAPATREAARAGLGLSGPAVLLFGRLAAEKDLDVALDAFARLSPALGARLVVVGDGPRRAWFEAEARRMGVGSSVLLLGELRGGALGQAVGACDALLVASRSETQSMTTIQALACGVPAVAVEAGGLPEYVGEGITGFLVPPRDAAALAARLERLLADEPLRRAMNRAAPASVARFTPAAVADRFETLYRSAIAARCARAQAKASWKSET